ncbi:hypothetical protein [Nocardioides alcanivorans]|uniref:hypothetical protein n=1 Tax=Nocardioides alcanivorans TaxID=2897352 RepID=UPI001F449DFE|nr:hypothetical protein [Nocardioides alcanivorans]
MSAATSTRTRADAEAWFVDQGLPYFVDAYRAQVQAGLRWPRLLAVVSVALVVGVPVGFLVATRSGEASLGFSAGVSAAGIVCGLYALSTLKAWLWFRWGVQQTLGSLELLVPLVTRALPMLLLFVTFLFINAEVWQVADTLDGGVMWGAVMLFAGIGVLFLLSRLPEEIDDFDQTLDAERLVRACTGTPLEEVAVELAGSDHQLRSEATVTGLQRANLLLVLLVAQLVQVVLLSLAVFAFFLAFGAVAMDAAVIESWTGHAPAEVLGPLNRELMQVSVFLAAFSGLYFAVYAVTDETYRQQFFTSITDDLQRAVSARIAYRSLGE